METRRRLSTSVGSRPGGSTSRTLARLVSQLAITRSRTRRVACTGRKRTGEAKHPDVDTTAAVERFLESPALAESTRRAYRIDLEEFAGWLEGRGLDLESFDARAFAEYASELGADRPGRRPRKLSETTLARKVAAVRSLIRATLGPSRVPDLAVSGRRRRRLPHAPRPEDTDALLEALQGDEARARRRPGALREERPYLRAGLFGRAPRPGGGRPHACRRQFRARGGPRSREGRQGARRAPR